MLLSDYLHSRYLAERPGLSADYRRLLESTVRGLCSWAGRPLELAEVDRALLAGWVTELLRLKYRPATVNERAASVRRLLLAAYDDGILDRPPRRLRRLPEYLPPPEAWTVDECRRLFAHLRRLPGRVGDAPASDWWLSLALTVYWTACRIGALMRTPVDDYEPQTGLTIRKQKNGRQQWYPLPPTCCDVIDCILPKSGRIWAWPLESKRIFRHFRKHVEASGVPAPKGHCQLFYRLKRTNLSYCAAEDPAIAQRQADHSDWETTRRHYVDPRIARQRSAADVLQDPLLDGPPRFRIVG